MPTYAYRCFDCGHEEEKWLRMSEFKPELPCPRCGGNEALKKVPQLSAGGFQLKGGGYYVTDFRNK